MNRIIPIFLAVLLLVLSPHGTPTARPSERSTSATAVADSWRRISLNLRAAEFHQVLDEMSKQSGIDLRMARRTPVEFLSKNVTLAMDGVPFWEAVVRVSQAASVGFRVSRAWPPDPNGVAVEFDPKADVIAKYQRLGPLVIGLKSSTAAAGEDSRPRFSLTLLRFADECEWEAPTLLPVVLTPGDGNAVTVRAFSGTDVEFLYAAPAGLQSKKQTLSCTLDVLPLGPSRAIPLAIKEGTVARDANVAITVKKVSEGAGAREVDLEINWDTGLPAEDVARFDRLRDSFSRGTDLRAQDLAFVRSVRSKARQIRITSLRCTDSSGGERQPERYEVVNDIVRASAKVFLRNEWKAESLRVCVASPLPGGGKAMTAEFRDALEVVDTKRENP